MIWIVGRYTGQDEDGMFLWNFCGAFDDKELAVAACWSDKHFVGPVVVNQAAGKKHVWVGSWYPMIESEEEGLKRGLAGQAAMDLEEATADG